jgi:DNA-directed RNA polymerase subunit RPC12/RpoP
MALVRCVECRKEVSDQAAVCPHCGIANLLRKAPEKPLTAGRKKRLGERDLSFWDICKVLIGLSLPAVLFVWCFASSDTSTASPQSAGCSSSDCVLRVSGTANVVVAVTKKSLNEMMSSGSDRAIAVMVLNGSAFLVPQNTPVSIVDRGLGVRKVLVTDGPMTGRAGWTPAEWVVAK